LTVEQKLQNASSLKKASSETNSNGVHPMSSSEVRIAFQNSAYVIHEVITHFNQPEQCSTSIIQIKAVRKILNNTSLLGDLDFLGEKIPQNLTASEFVGQKLKEVEKQLKKRAKGSNLSLRKRNNSVAFLLSLKQELQKKSVNIV